MLNFVTIANNEEYRVEGKGLAIVVMLTSGSVNILSSDNQVLAILDSEAESYSIMDNTIIIKGISAVNKLIVGSFPVLL